MMTVGPWKSARLEAYDYRIDDVRVDYDFVRDAHDQAKVRVRGELVSGHDCTAPGKVAWTLRDADKSTVASGEQSVPGSSIDIRFQVQHVKAWYPKGYGTQSLYELELRLIEVRSAVRRGQLLVLICSHPKPMLLPPLRPESRSAPSSSSKNRSSIKKARRSCSKSTVFASFAEAAIGSRQTASSQRSATSDTEPGSSSWQVYFHS